MNRFVSKRFSGVLPLIELMLINGDKKEKNGSTIKSNESGGRSTNPITFTDVAYTQIWS